MFTKLKKLFILSLLGGTSAFATYFPTVSVDNFDVFGIYNLTLPTLTDGGMSQIQVNVNGKLRSIDENVESQLIALNSKIPSIGAHVTAASVAVNVASDQVVPVSMTGLPLPTGAATEAKQDDQITILSSIDSIVDDSNAYLSSIDGKTPALGQALAAGSVPVVLPAAQIATLTPLSTIAATQSGTWNLNNITGTVSLPTGASTEATLAAMSAKIANNYGAASGAVRTASQVGNASGIADFGSGALSAQTLRVVLPTDQPAIATKNPINVTGSGSAAAATVSTVTSLSAPANAVGFILMNLDTSTANIRWAVGRTASTTLGQQLQPGRDTGFVPIGANVSIIAESGTQNYDIQWIAQ